MDSHLRHAFVKDPVEVYKPVEIVRILAATDEYEVTDYVSQGSSAASSGKTFVVKTADCYPIASVEELANPPPDLIKLMVVNLPAILHSLKHRFQRDLIYTSVGPILVAVNPFKWIKGIYDEDVIMDYFHEKFDLSSDPHVFAITNEAFQGLQDKLNQSLIISGESGAGKTETTKQCLNYLAKIAGSTSGVQTKILLASPILEAWGNAKTLRNNNSSRFGKFIEIWFDSRNSIVGSSNTTYLLEKSRVVFQEGGERNYHVFYQLLQGADSALRRELNIEAMSTRPESVKFINQSGCIAIDEVDDAKDFHVVEHALEVLNFSPGEVKTLWYIVASVLHLGNIDFAPDSSDSDVATIAAESVSSLKSAIRLMGLDELGMQQALLKKRIATGGKRASITFSPYTVPNAFENRNSLVKELYNRSFDWIVNKINLEVNGDPQTSSRGGMIGILDIFGFEIFKKNSFEQLCINLANEALQQHFNFNIFRVEMELYRSEDIPIPDLNFNDNQDVLDLIMKKNGIIPVLDEEGLVPKGSWEGFLSKIIKLHHPGNKRFKNKHITREFSVVHYAGEVTYDPKLFLAKNKDTLSPEIVDELALSSNDVIKFIFQSSIEPQDDSPKRGSVVGAVRSGGSSNKMTVGKKFTMQLESLIQNLNTTKPHYIRCIKPNDIKKPNIFMSDLSHEQLTYSGVFEAVIILQSGYPFRLQLFDFRQRFHMLILDKEGRQQIFGPSNETSGPQLKQRCGTLINLAIARGHKMLTDSFLGTSKVFYRAPVHYYLVRVRNEIMARGLRNLQRYSRGYLVRKLYRQIVKANDAGARAVTSRDMTGMTSSAATLEDLFQRLNKATPPAVQVKSDIAKICRGLHDAMLVEVEAVDSLKKILADKTKFFDNMDKIVATLDRAKAIISFEGTLRGEKLSHTWQQNPYLVQVEGSVRAWVNLADTKNKIRDAISANDELALETLVIELKNSLSGELGGLVDLTDIISLSENALAVAKKRFEDFYRDSYPQYFAGRFALVGYQPELRSYRCSVDKESLLPLLTLYQPTATGEILTRLSAKRVKLCVDIFHGINAMRSLAKMEAWTVIWSVFYRWKDFLSLSDNIFEKTPASMIRTTPIATESVSHRNRLEALPSLSSKDISFLPQDLVDHLRVELIDLLRATIASMLLPSVVDAVESGKIPSTLHLDPSKAGVDVSTLTTVLSGISNFENFFDETLRSAVNVAREHLTLRTAFLTGNHDKLTEALKTVPDIDRKHDDFAHGSIYRDLFESLSDAKIAIFESGPIGPTGGLDFGRLDEKQLSKSLDVIGKMQVQESLWAAFISLSSLLVTVRRMTLNEQFVDAVSAIKAGQTQKSWSAVSASDYVFDPSVKSSQETLPTVVTHVKYELELFWLDLRHRVAVRALKEAVAIDNIIGLSGRLDCSQVNHQKLQDALNTYILDVIVTTSDYQLVRDCEQLVILRQQIEGSDWTAIGEIIASLKRASLDFTTNHINTRNEFKLIYHGYMDNLAVLELQQTITINKIAVDSNHEECGLSNRSSDALTHIKASIDRARGLEFRSDLCLSLLISVEYLYFLRLAVHQQRWHNWNLLALPNKARSLRTMQKDILAQRYTIQDGETIVENIVTYATRSMSANDLNDTVSVQSIIEALAGRLSAYPFLIQEEFSAATIAFNEYRNRLILLVSASTGQITLDVIDSANRSSVSINALTLANWFIKQQKDLSSIVKNWLAATDKLLYLRIAVVSSNSSFAADIEVEEYLNLDELNDMHNLIVDDFPMNEMKETVEAIYDRRAFRALAHEFTLGRPKVNSGDFDAQFITTDGLESQLSAVKRLTYRSDRLDRLMFYADLCIQLRRALLANLWDDVHVKTNKTVKDILAEYKRAEAFFTTLIDSVPPNILKEDFNMVDLEYDRRVLIRSCPAAFERGRIGGHPLELTFNAVNSDALIAHMKRVEDWGARAGQLGTELTTFLKAAQELIDIRSETRKIQAEYQRIHTFAPGTKYRVKDVLSTSFVSDAIDDAMKNIESLGSKSGLASGEWSGIVSRMSWMNHANAIPSARYEISLLVCETFDRTFLVKTSQLLRTVEKYYIEHRLETINATFAGPILAQLLDCCENFRYRLESLPHLISPVLHILHYSAVICVHLLRANIEGKYDDSSRSWRENESGHLSEDYLFATAHTESLSVQSIILTVQKGRRIAHAAIQNVLALHDRYIEDMISQKEMFDSISATSRHINADAKDTKDSLNVGIIDVDTLLLVKQRIDLIGTTESATTWMYRSFSIIYELRVALKNNDFDGAYEVLDDFLCYGHRDMSTLLAVVLSHEFYYEAHSLIQEELEVIVKVVIDTRLGSLALLALMTGAVVGERGALELSQVSWKDLDEVLELGNANFPWSKATCNILNICSQMSFLRKSVVNVDDYRSESIQMALAPESEFSSVTINRPNKLVQIFQVPVDLAFALSQDLSSSGLLTSQEIEVLASECNLIQSHCQFMLTVTELMEVMLISVIEFSESGLYVIQPSYLQWQATMTRVNELDLKKSLQHESWYHRIYSGLCNFVGLADTIFATVNKSSDTSTVSLSYDFLGDDRLLELNVNDISRLRTLIESVHQKAKSPMKSTTKNDVDVDHLCAFVRPGSTAFESIRRRIQSVIDSCMNITGRSDDPLMSRIYAVSRILFDSLLEHRNILTVKSILHSHAIEDCSVVGGRFCIRVSALPGRQATEAVSFTADQFEGIPWLQASASTIDVLPASFDERTYTSYVSVLQQLELSTAFGRSFRTITRLVIELRLCAASQDWSKGQVLSYLLSHIPLPDDELVEDAKRFRKAVDMLTLGRRLEQGIMCCMFPPVSGWSLTAASAKLSLSINDMILKEAIQDIDVNYAQLVSSDPLLESLLQLSRSFVDLVAKIRNDRWRAAVSSISSPVLDLVVASNASEMMVVYLTQTEEQYTVEDYIDVIDEVSSSSSVSRVIKQFVFRQVEVLRMEAKVRELVAEVVPALATISVVGEPGNVSVTRESLDILTQVISLLTSSDVHSIVVKSFVLASILQSCALLYNLIISLDSRQSSAKILSIMRYMSTIPPFNCGQPCMENMIKESQSLEDIRRSKDHDLDEKYQAWMSSFEAVNNETMQSYLAAVPEHENESMMVKPFQDLKSDFNEDACGGFSFENLVCLREEFVDSIAIVEKHIFYQELHEEFLVALSDTPASGEPGELQVDNISFSRLERVQSRLRMYNIHIMKDVTPGYLLFQTATLLYRLRIAQKEGDLVGIRLALDLLEQTREVEAINLEDRDGPFSVLAAAAEIDFAIADWEQRHLVHRLEECLHTAGVPIVDECDDFGWPTPDSLAAIVIDTIENVLADVANISPTSKSALTHFQSVQSILHIRRYFVSANWRDLHQYIGTLRVDQIVPIAAPEVIRAQRFALIYMAISLASWGYRHGSAILVLDELAFEDVGDDLFTKIIVENVRDANDALEKLPQEWRTTSIQRHIDCSNNLYHLRRLLITRNWQAAYDITCVILHPRRLATSRTYEEVVREFLIVRNYLAERISVDALRNALRNGMVEGSLGRVSLMKISTRVLESAIKLCVDLGASSKSAVKLLNSARIVQRLRLAQMKGIWFTSPSNDLGFSEIEYAILPFGNVSVEAAIIQIETGVSIATNDNRVIGSPTEDAKQSLMKKMKEKEGMTARGKSSSILISSSAPLWMKAVDYIPSDFRESALDKATASVDDVLKEVTSDSIASEASHELEFAQKELLYRRIIFCLLVGLNSKGPEGVSGALDVSTINVSLLKAAITFAEKHPESSGYGRCESLLRDAKFLLAMRLKRLQLEWKKLKSIIDSVKEININPYCSVCEGSSVGQGLSKHQPIFSLVWDELLKYESDLSFQLCLALFAEEMTKKYDFKDGNLGSKPVDTTPVAALVEVINSTKKAAMIYTSSEYDRLLEAQNIALQLRLRRLYEPNRSARDIVEATNAIRSRDSRLDLPSYISFLTTDINHMSNVSSLQHYSNSLEREIVVGQQYIKSPVGRINLGEINTSKLQQMIQSSSSLLKTLGSKSDLALLKIANAMVHVRKTLSTGLWDDVRAVVKEHEEVLSTPLVRVEGARLIAEADNYDVCRAFERCLKQGRYVDVVKIAKLMDRPKRKRLQSVIDMKYLTDTFSAEEESKPRRRGSIKPMTAPVVNDFEGAMVEIGEAIDWAKNIELRSDETNMFLKAALLIYRMRAAIKNNSWDEVHKIIFEEANDGLLPAIVMEEIKAVRSGLHYKDTITKIADAMIGGAVKGSPGRVDMSELDYSALQRSLLDIGDQNMADSAMKIMQTIAQKLCNVRRAIKEGRWSKSDSSFSRVSVENDAEESSEIVVPGRLNVEEYVEEFMRYLDEQSPQLRSILKIADDEEDDDDEDDSLSLISSTEVSVTTAVRSEFASRVPFSSPAAESSQLARKSVRVPSKRSAVDWLEYQWVAVKASKEEVKLIMWEIKERNLRERLIRAIEYVPALVHRFGHRNKVHMNKDRIVFGDDFSFFAGLHSHGNVEGKRDSLIAGIEEDSLHISNLENVLFYVQSHYSEADDFISQDVSILVATAELLLKFRRSIVNGVDLNEYRSLIEESASMREKGLISESYGVMELRAYKSASVTVEIARTELLKAISTGKIRGYLDHLDLHLIEVTNLSHWVLSSESLLETAQELAVGLSSIVREASMILRIRQAVKAGNWSSLRSTWTEFFTRQGQMRTTVEFQYIHDEVVHAFTAYRLQELLIQLRDMLDESYDLDLEKRYSLLIVKSVQLSSILSDLKRLFAYTSEALLPSANTPISPSNDANKLYECGRITVDFWSAICHRHWGADILAAGELGEYSSPIDPFLATAFDRFDQKDVQERYPDMIGHLTAESLSAASSSLLASSSIDRPSANIHAAISSAKNFFVGFNEVGSSESGKVAKSRRISITSVGRDVAMMGEATASQSQSRRRLSVTDATKEFRRNSLSGAVRSNSVIMTGNRRPSVFTTMDEPPMTVLEILSKYRWTEFPTEVKQQYFAARNVLIDQALRLRLISCCSVGEVTIDEHGGLLVPDMRYSVDLLELAMSDERFLCIEAEKRNIDLSWSSETFMWIRTAKILLSSRSALAENRVDDLVNELVAAGFIVGFKQFNPEYLSLASLPEFNVMEQFVVESVAESTIKEAIMFLLREYSVRRKTSLSEVTFSVSILQAPAIAALAELREPMFARRDSTAYYDGLRAVTEAFFLGLQGAIVGNQYQVREAREAVRTLLSTPPCPLAEMIHETDRLHEYLLAAARATNRSASLDDIGEMLSKQSRPTSFPSRRRVKNQDPPAQQQQPRTVSFRQSAGSIEPFSRRTSAKSNYPFADSAAVESKDSDSDILQLQGASFMSSLFGRL